MFSRKSPSIALVMVVEFCFSTPRITMQRWRASMMTPTPCGLEFVLNGVRDLAGEALLNLQAASVHIHQPRDFAEPHDLFLGM